MSIRAKLWLFAAAMWIVVALVGVYRHDWWFVVLGVVVALLNIRAAADEA